MKTFKYLVNGLEVEAKYDEEDIDKVYKPLLNHWYDLYKQKQCRIVIFIAGWKNRPDFSCKPESILCRNKWICFVGYAIDSEYGSNYGKGFF